MSQPNNCSVSPSSLYITQHEPGYLGEAHIATNSKPNLSVPKHWKESILSAVTHVISLATYILCYTRSWAANSANARVRLSAEKDQLQQQVAILREEIRIKDSRMASIPAARRPHYQLTQRLAILELRAARGWSLAQTARTFQVTEATNASWTNRLDEQAPAALLRLAEPVNKFPDFVRYLVQRLQTHCPLLGKVKIAQILARAGLHLAVSNVGRIRRQPPVPEPTPIATTPAMRRVTAREPNHV